MSERLKALVTIRVDQWERCVRNRRAQPPRLYAMYSVPFSYITSSPSFSLRDGRASETRARVKTTPRVKGEPFLSSGRVSPFLLGVIFTRARVWLNLPSLRENERLLVVYLFSSRNKSPFYHARHHAP